MKAWQCNRCGAEIKEELHSCPLCRGKDFSEITLPDPTPEDLAMTEKYEKTLQKMEEYEKGTPPKKFESCCGSGCCKKED